MAASPKSSVRQAGADAGGPSSAATVTVKLQEPTLPQASVREQEVAVAPRGKVGPAVQVGVIRVSQASSAAGRATVAVAAPDGTSTMRSAQ